MKIPTARSPDELVMEQRENSRVTKRQSLMNLLSNETSSFRNQSSRFEKGADWKLPFRNALY